MQLPWDVPDAARVLHRYRARAILAADLNGDAQPDLMTANFGHANISVLLGNGDGTFQPERHFDVVAIPWSAAEADVNGDGRLDVVTADANDDVVSVLRGNGDGTFQAPRPFVTGDSPRSVAVGDLND